ncbi:cell wall hydrolase [Kaarinaea lacus]
MRALLLQSLVIFFFGMLAANPVMASSISDKKEMRCLAQNIYFEAQGEPSGGQLAVALVTMNRVKNRRYPNTVCGVVWQHRQFSWTHDGKSDRPRDRLAWRRARQIANFIYSKYFKLPERSRQALDITNGALHYYAPNLANPYWAKVKVVTREIGGHVFLREKYRNEHHENS